MKKIAIVTDSNSGITQEEGKELGISVLPMPFYIDGQIYYEDITLSQEEFYQKLSENADISTSQPSPADVLELWEKLLNEYEQVVHISMSSGLSASCETAIALSQDFEGKVQVVNNQRISVTQRQSVLDALALAREGMDALQVKEILEKEKNGIQHLHYAGNIKISEKRRQNHPGGGSHRNYAEVETCTADSG